MLSRLTLRAYPGTRTIGLTSSLKCALVCDAGLLNHCALSRDFRTSTPYLSSSSTRWKKRQSKDSFSKEAKVQGLKSRAAFKLLEIDAKYRIFRKGQTVIDLGYAPGSWSQVAVERTKPNGRIVGIDIIPAQPPKGVSTIQGNFLSAEVREEVKRFLSDPDRGRPKEQFFELPENPNFLRTQRAGGVELEIGTDGRHKQGEGPVTDVVRRTTRRDEDNGEVVDIVLSDMSAPWDQTTGFWKRSLSDPYNRMMNTSGIAFKDHAGSMDLCTAALQFAFESLKTGGHFVCKFYQGSEDKAFEKKLRKLFGSVHREKPESSRSESKEAYFVALRKKHGVDANMLVDEEHVV
ncbi:S-adenosyl-L-methionine-dependent methyltransferase [Glarea lozoyensis ATCC 20868]|uniref:rRNA methyltransferase 2, mitochondrial n=1 Tax=Glarea lozoyensis (strain ATCC 20868 / MF5171) TaxID=1116229 RepID=S3CS04_GLAL2|nr:S-adenosyl-L-methionine-dependent methyltransferase [Glarea lozoyensis ATCC 20868]EPE27834.1 S-adenosyl-L-methionine-dependent methyltransferase [Glarea lozoyensis ATCC 20868]